jgi:hypothetical protein
MPPTDRDPLAEAALRRELPAAVYACNAPLSALRTAELFTVMTLRLWVEENVLCDTCRPAERRQEGRWRGGLRAAGIEPSAAPAFDMLCRLSFATTARRLDVRRSGNPRLGRDEALFLQCLGLLQHRRSGSAERLLGEWLPRAAHGTALLAAMQLASALDAARLHIPQRSGGATRVRVIPFPRDRARMAGQPR